MTKSIVLCADDYGQAPAISQGIIRLIKKRCLSATSCLVNMPYCMEHAEWLKPFESDIDIGLHFNLTEGAPLSKAYRARYGEVFWPLKVLLRKAFLHQLDPQIIRAECHAQIDQFVSVFGRLPRFIDGHQHIHQFPIIRHVLVEVYQARFLESQAYIRLIHLKPKLTDFKKWMIYLTGAKALTKLVSEAKIPANSSFEGVYSFDNSRQYNQIFGYFLRNIKTGGLIMCHPGLCDLETKDPIAKARYDEYQYFDSPQFKVDCEREKVVIKPFV